MRTGSLFYFHFLSVSFFSHCIWERIVVSHSRYSTCEMWMYEFFFYFTSSTLLFCFLLWAYIRHFLNNVTMMLCVCVCVSKRTKERKGEKKGEKWRENRIGWAVLKHLGRILLNWISSFSPTCERIQTDRQFCCLSNYFLFLFVEVFRWA